MKDTLTIKSKVFAEFKRVWGVDGMPLDKIKLATAAFGAGYEAGYNARKYEFFKAVVRLVDRVMQLLSRRARRAIEEAAR